MRARSVVSVIAVLLTGIALKLALFGPTQVAAVSSFKSSGLDIELMHQGAKSLPELKFQDMTFVFPASE
jgi:hypothetical protein